MNNETIVFTIDCGDVGSNYGEIRSSNANVDKFDKKYPIHSYGLRSELKRLTSKYNQRGFAVLFEVE